MTEVLPRYLDVLGTSPLGVTNTQYMEQCVRESIPDQVYSDRQLPYFRSLTSGQDKNGHRDWITADIKNQEGRGEGKAARFTPNPDLDFVHVGDYRDYDGISFADVNKNHGDGLKPRLSANEIAKRLTYAEEFREDYTDFQEILGRYGLVGAGGQEGSIAFKWGQPTPLDFALFTLVGNRKNPLPALENVEPFRRAYQMQLDQVYNSGNDPCFTFPFRPADIVTQFEMPALAAVMAKAPHSLRGMSNTPVADRLARRIIAPQVEGVPEGGRVMLHPCWGDFHHVRYTEPDIALSCALMKSAIDFWPEGRILDSVHLPLGAPGLAPPLKERDYRAIVPLANKLRELGHGTRIVAGLLHEEATDSQQQQVLRIVEAKAQQAVDVSYFCGFGRVEHAVANMLMQRGIRMIDPDRLDLAR